MEFKEHLLIKNKAFHYTKGIFISLGYFILYIYKIWLYIIFYILERFPRSLLLSRHSSEYFQQVRYFY